MNKYIITGPIRTGKTTAVEECIVGRADVGGFLSPDRGEFRTLKMLKTGISIQMEIPFGTRIVDDESINIGKFKFYKSSFDQVIQQTILDLEDDSISLIIIDEIGKLEMKDKGFHDLFRICLQGKKNMAIIVREILLNDVIKKYRLEDAQTVAVEDICDFKKSIV